MISPPPGGTPPHSVRASLLQIATMTSRWRGSMKGFGVRGATAGVAALPAGADAVAGAGAAPPPMAATALWQDGESLAVLRCRHCSAAAPPGCTPAHSDRKSERHAERTAAVCASLGVTGAAAAGAGAAGAAVMREGSAGFLAGAAIAGFAADAGVPSAAWQAGDSFAALALRQDRISGLLGAIEGQCATRSLSAQAFCTAFKCVVLDNAGVGGCFGCNCRRFRRWRRFRLRRLRLLCRRFGGLGRCRNRRRRRGRLRRNGIHGSLAGRRELGDVALETFKGVLAARRDAGTVRHKIGAAGRPDGIDLVVRRLLRRRRLHAQQHEQRAHGCGRSRIRTFTVHGNPRIRACFCQNAVTKRPCLVQCCISDLNERPCRGGPA